MTWALLSGKPLMIYTHPGTRHVATCSATGGALVLNREWWADNVPSEG